MICHMYIKVIAILKVIFHTYLQCIYIFLLFNFSVLLLTRTGFYIIDLFQHRKLPQKKYVFYCPKDRGLQPKWFRPTTED